MSLALYLTIVSVIGLIGCFWIGYRDEDPQWFPILFTGALCWPITLVLACAVVPFVLAYRVGRGRS